MSCQAIKVLQVNSIILLADKKNVVLHSHDSYQYQITQEFMWFDNMLIFVTIFTKDNNEKVWIAFLLDVTMKKIKFGYKLHSTQYFFIEHDFWQIYHWITFFFFFIFYTCKISKKSNINSFLSIKCLNFKSLKYKIMQKK